MPAKNQLTKRHIAVAISKRYDGIPYALSADIVDNVLDQIVAAFAAGRDAEFRNFGGFRVVKRASRPGRNPNKPTETVQVPAKLTVRFKPGKVLRARLKDLNASKGAPTP